MHIINKNESSAKSDNRIYGLQSLDQKLTSLLKPMFQGNKKEFLIINNLVKNWEEIVGKKYSKSCYPKAINFSKNPRDSFSQAKLTIAVHNSSIGFFLENNSEFLLEKIAALYGFKAVHKIIIKQELKPSEAIEEDAKLSPTEEKNLQEKIKDITDPELAKTLARLGREILSNK
ncbi:MAG: DUF721 domain-containing protein [Rickettsiales bacterium]|nr:DUF721 domain-containing protein [Rickettsiales bacterium]